MRFRRKIKKLIPWQSRGEERLHCNMKSKVAFLGVYIALALIFSYVEMLIPFSFGVPGMKLGLANLITLTVLYKVGRKEAYCFTLARVVLTGFLFGNYFSILYSLSGGLLGLFAMDFSKKRGGYSIFGVSMLGGVFHNIGQVFMAGIVLETSRILYYLPILLISGLGTGFLIGFLASEAFRRLGKGERYS